MIAGWSVRRLHDPRMNFVRRGSCSVFATYFLNLAVDVYSMAPYGMYGSNLADLSDPEWTYIVTSNRHPSHIVDLSNRRSVGS